MYYHALFHSMIHVEFSHHTISLSIIFCILVCSSNLFHNNAFYMILLYSILGFGMYISLYHVALFDSTLHCITICSSTLYLVLLFLKYIV